MVTFQDTRQKSLDRENSLGCRQNYWTVKYAKRHNQKLTEVYLSSFHDRKVEKKKKKKKKKKKEKRKKRKVF